MTSHPKSDEEQLRLIVNHVQKPISKQFVQNLVKSAFYSLAAEFIILITGKTFLNL